MGKVKVLGYEALYLLLMLASSFCSALIQTLFPKDLGTYASLFYSGRLYGYNLFFYIIGVGVFIAAMIFGYKFILAKHISKLADSGIVLKVLYFIVAVIGCLLVFVGIMFMFFIRLGWATDIRPEMLLYISWFGWPIILLIFLIFVFVKNVIKK